MAFSDIHTFSLHCQAVKKFGINIGLESMGLKLIDKMSLSIFKIKLRGGVEFLCCLKNWIQLVNPVNRVKFITAAI